MAIVELDVEDPLAVLDGEGVWVLVLGDVATEDHELGGGGI